MFTFNLVGNGQAICVPKVGQHDVLLIQQARQLCRLSGVYLVTIIGRDLQISLIRRNPSRILLENRLKHCWVSSLTS